MVVAPVLEKQVVSAFRRGATGLACILVRQLDRTIHVNDLTLWVCTITACRLNGNGSLRELALALPHTAMNPAPGLALMMGLGAAIDDGDEYTMRRLAERARNAAPGTSRLRFAGALRRIRANRDGSLQPGTDEARQYWANLLDLSA